MLLLRLWILYTHIRIECGWMLVEHTYALYSLLFMCDVIERCRGPCLCPRFTMETHTHTQTSRALANTRLINRKRFCRPCHAQHHLVMSERAHVCLSSRCWRVTWDFLAIIRVEYICGNMDNFNLWTRARMIQYIQPSELLVILKEQGFCWLNFRMNSWRFNLCQAKGLNTIYATQWKQCCQAKVCCVGSLSWLHT